MSDEETPIRYEYPVRGRPDPRTAEITSLTEEVKRLERVVERVKARIVEIANDEQHILTGRVAAGLILRELERGEP